MLYWMLNIDFKLHKVVYFHGWRIRAPNACNANGSQPSANTIHIEISVRIPNSCKLMYNNEGKKTIQTKRIKERRKDSTRAKFSHGTEYNHVFWMKCAVYGCIGPLGASASSLAHRRMVMLLVTGVAVFTFLCLMNWWIKATNALASASLSVRFRAAHSLDVTSLVACRFPRVTCCMKGFTWKKSFSSCLCSN